MCPPISLSYVGSCLPCVPCIDSGLLARTRCNMTRYTWGSCGVLWFYQPSPLVGCYSSNTPDLGTLTSPTLDAEVRVHEYINWLKGLQWWMDFTSKYYEILYVWLSCRLWYKLPGLDPELESWEQLMNASVHLTLASRTSDIGFHPKRSCQCSAVTALLHVVGLNNSRL